MVVLAYESCETNVTVCFIRVLSVDDVVPCSFVCTLLSAELLSEVVAYGTCHKRARAVWCHGCAVGSWWHRAAAPRCHLAVV